MIRITKILPRMAPAATLALALVAVVVLPGCGPSTPEERMTEVQTLLAEGQTARAVIKLKEIVRDLPEDPMGYQARLVLARYYASEGNANQALEQLYAVYDSADPLGPEATSAFEGLLQINLQLDDYETTHELIETQLERVGETDPMQTGQLQAVRASMKLDFGEEDVKPEGDAELTELMLEHPEPMIRGQAREMLADYYRRAGNFDESNNVYRLYLEQYPDDALRDTLEMTMAINTWRAGDKEEGAAQFEEAAQTYMEATEEEIEKSQRARRLLELARLYQEIDRLDRSEELMKQVMGENPMSQTAIQTQFEIGMMYVQHDVEQEDEEMYERGLGIFEQIRAENPNSNIAETAEARLEQAQAAWNAAAAAHEQAEAAQAAIDNDAGPQQAEPESADEPDAE